MLKVACAIIVDELGRVLAAQRSLRMEHPLKWEFPGGKIEKNETPEAALVREIREELGIRVEIFKGLTPCEYQYPEKSIVLLPYICHGFDNQMSLKEHCKVAWLYPAQLKELDWVEADIAVLDEFLAESER